MMKLNTSNGSELLSYIINQDPVLSENIDLPVQGESIKPIGQIIVDNQRYRNAFINAINVIAVTIITKNTWDNPWEEFTEQGKIRFGQSVREMIVDLVKGHDGRKIAYYGLALMPTALKHNRSHQHRYPNTRHKSNRLKILCRIFHGYK